MTAGRGPRRVLGGTLLLCGAALLALVLHRETEIVAAMTPLPDSAPLAARALAKRTSRDKEIWVEALAAVLGLVFSGWFLASPSSREKRPVDRHRLEKLEAGLAQARSNEAAVRAKLAEAEAAAARAQSLVLDQQAKSEHEVELLNAQIEGLAGELVQLPTNGTTRLEISGEALSSAPPPRIAEGRSIAAPASTVRQESQRPRSSSHPHHRRDVRFAVNVEVDFESESHFYTGLTENLSEGGIFVATYSPRPVGTVMDLALKLTGHPEPIRAQGTVRWVREFSDASDTVPGMGLNLTLDDRDLPRIRRFLSTRPPLFFDDA